jgi:hypothetical protein
VAQRNLAIALGMEFGAGHGEGRDEPVLCDYVVAKGIQNFLQLLRLLYLRPRRSCLLFLQLPAHGDDRPGWLEYMLSDYGLRVISMD